MFISLLVATGTTAALTDDGHRARPASVAELEAAASRSPVCAPGEHQMLVDGLSRRYVLTLPPSSSAPRPPPVLLAFHGYTGSPDFFTETTDLSRAAASAGWAVVAGAGSGEPPRWQLQALPGADDIRFVHALLARLAETGCADIETVAVAGYSNGAGFAAGVACEIPVVAALLVSGANLGPTCAAAGASIVVVHSRDDAVVPIEGGPVLGGMLWAVDLGDTLGGWRLGGADVTEVVVEGVGHRWPAQATAELVERLPTG